MIGDTTQASGIVRMCDLTFDKSLFENFDTHTVLDRLLCSYRELPKVGFERYEQKALEAMETQCSLSELQKVTSSLSGILKGISHASVDSILPTRKYEEYFMSRGVDIKRQGRIVKTDLTVWTLFNMLTSFATHTDLMAPEDGARNEILRHATQLLLAERDIKHYIE